MRAMLDPNFHTRVRLIAFLAAVALVAIFVYVIGARYYIIPSGDGRVYKIDRITGHTWVLEGEREYPIQREVSSLATEEARAITLAKLAYSIDSSSMDQLDNDSWIQRKLQSVLGPLKVYGWSAKRVDDATYVVSYTYDTGEGKRGHFLEVNLEANLVRNIVGNPWLEEKYKIEIPR